MDVHSDGVASPDHYARGTTARRRAAVVLALCAGAATPALAAHAHAGAPDGGGDFAVWQRLADCESGANWHANTGNGYYGGLQFDGQTWQAYGGDRFAVYAHKASPREQISIGKAVRRDHGDYGAWPSCARKLGLPT